MKTGGYIDERKKATRLDTEPNPVEARRAYSHIFAYFADEESKRKRFIDAPKTCTYPMCNANTPCVYGENISPELQDAIETLIESDMHRYIAGKNPRLPSEVVSDGAKSRISFLNIHGKGFYDTCHMGKLRELHGSENEIRAELKARGKNNYEQKLKTAKRLISEGRAQLKSAEDIVDTLSFYELSVGDTLMPSEVRCLETLRGSFDDKENSAIEKIRQGLAIYAELLTKENQEHSKRIKTAIEYTAREFEKYLPEIVLDAGHTALFIRPE